MFEVSTDRLRLIPLDPDQLRLFLDDRPALEKRLDLNPSSERLWKPLYQRFNYEHKVMAASEDWTKIYRWITLWLIVQKEENRIIGGIHFHYVPDDSRTTEVGIYIWDDHRSRGYGVEALRRMVDYALNETEVVAVEGRVDKDNPYYLCSRKMFEKIGSDVSCETDVSVLFTISRKHTMSSSLPGSDPAV